MSFQDSESGLIYLRNRYYDPTVGRFINEDPIKDGTNWYAYCGNNPVMFVDPMGFNSQFLNLGGYSDNVEVGLRDMVYYHGGTKDNIIVRDDSVVVSLNGQKATYYYNPSPDNIMHSNRMVDGSMMVDAVSFGEHFGLIQTKSDYGTSSVRFMANLGEGITGATANYSYWFSVSYVETPNGIAISKQEADFTRWGWTGQPGETFAAPPTLIFSNPTYSGGETDRTTFLSNTCTHDSHITSFGTITSCYISYANIMLPKGTTKGKAVFTLMHGSSNMVSIGSPSVVATITF